MTQDVIITERCRIFDGIIVTPINGRWRHPWGRSRDRIVGRISQEDIYDPLPGDERRTKSSPTSGLSNIQEPGIEQVKIHSILRRGASPASRGVCRRCYGRNLASGKLVEIGEDVGVIAAESIGQPGTQLSIRSSFIND